MSYVSFFISCSFIHCYYHPEFCMSMKDKLKEWTMNLWTIKTDILIDVWTLNLFLCFVFHLQFPNFKSSIRWYWNESIFCLSIFSDWLVLPPVRKKNEATVGSIVSQGAVRKRDVVKKVKGKGRYKTWTADAMLKVSFLDWFFLFLIGKVVVWFYM